MRNPPSDETLLALLLGSDAERQAALNTFFQDLELYHRALRHVQTHGGAVQDGKDVFIESFLIFERAVRNGVFRGASSLHTYFQGIVKWAWHNEKQRRKPYESLPETAALQPNPENFVIKNEQRVILRQLLQLIGERCKNLLTQWQMGFSMLEIAAEAGFENANVAGKEVHKCRQKLRAILDQQPEQADALQPDANDE